MAGMTAKHKKGRVTYSFSGDLEECIKKAQKELQQKEDSEERTFLRWQHERAKKAHETYERRISDLRGFIELGKEELEKRRIAKQQSQEVTE